MLITKNANRLANEKSPYLLQHAYNPVDWHPWDDKAFSLAAELDKPIFLSIGYSTCHWCHVMAHESFEDEQVARLMNETFVCIKVDREERPDIDDVYMTVCQLITGSGGWPLTIIMSPDKQPFFAATYLPKSSRFGRMGMMELAPRVRYLWQEKRDDLLKSAQSVSNTLSSLVFTDVGSDFQSADLDQAYRYLLARFDAVKGGFGGAPKFPMAHRLGFLLRYWRRSGEDKALQMVTETLRAMRCGGIYDQIGFGFHRYSTDARWLTPHFEKMLYDQALAAIAYLEAYQATGEEEFARTAREIFTYVLRDMTDGQGGFYSAEDADSEGEEGRFYVWNWADIVQTLSPEEAELAAKVFNLEPDGNFNDEASGQATGVNILHMKKGIARLAASLSMQPEQLADQIETIRAKLFSRRNERVRPHKDDKILTDWNGLMIAALAKGAQVLGDEKYAQAATKAVDFIRQNMLTPEGRLLHRWREGEAAVAGYLDDYAFFIWGLQELYEATFDVELLKLALRLNDNVIKHYGNGEQGGFFFTADDGEKLLTRKMEIYDGALPSGNSLMLLNLLRLARITADPKLEEAAAKQARVFSTSVRRAPGEFGMFLSEVDFALGPSYEVVIAGFSQSDPTRQMLHAIRKTFAPNKVLLLRPQEDDLPPIAEVAPYTQAQTAAEGPLVYLCRDYQCEQPTGDIGRVLALLDGQIDA